MLPTIEQEMHVDAPIERVWQIVTDPAYVAQWFGDTAAIDLRPGGTMTLGWAEYGDFHAAVERVEPPTGFAFRWNREPGVPVAPGNDSTLVEITLAPAGDGTLLRLVESGFTDETHRTGNVEGWASELGELKEFAQR
jgi:uncharacterized protein YndB with AHSA1/START domain